MSDSPVESLTKKRDRYAVTLSQVSAQISSLELQELELTGLIEDYDSAIDTLLNEVAPVNTVAPVVSGVPEVNEILSVTEGTWSSADSFVYNWQHSTDGVNDWADATDGNGSDTYELPAQAEGEYVRCVVTATNPAGSTPVNSNVVGPVISNS